LLLALACPVALAALHLAALPSAADPAAAGPIRVFKYDRSTQGAASLTDAEGSLSDRDRIEAPDTAPFFAEASAGVSRNGASAAGVTRHISSIGGRSLVLDGHCDANVSVKDLETQHANASCGDHYEIGFELTRPVKASLVGEISSATTGLAGGYGEISLRTSSGEVIAEITGDFGMLDERLILAPGSYRLLATGSAGASISPDGDGFSAVTFDQRVTLGIRNY
jgi:hypothetical protein